MTKGFDALYGSILDDVLMKDVSPTIPKADDVERIVTVLKARAEGYYNRSSQFRENGEYADAEAAMGTCRELAYVAKMFDDGKLEQLEAAGK